MKGISIDDLADVICEELQAYSDEVTSQIKEDVKQVASECVEDIRRRSPENTGKYKKGWKQKVAYESKNDIRITIYNSNKPQITHLLEHGYVRVNGKRVEGRPHIKPAEVRAEKSLLDKIEVAVQ